MPSPAAPTPPPLDLRSDALRHFYIAEEKGLLDKMDPDVRAQMETHVARARQANMLPLPGIANYQAFSDAIDSGQNFPGAITPRGQETSTTSTTTSDSFAPGEALNSRSGVGRVIGSTLGGLGGSALGTMGGPASIVTVPTLGVAGARSGGMLGEIAQQKIEELLGLTPSTAGDLTSRMRAGAGTSTQGELLAQGLSAVTRIPGAAFRTARAMTPTAKATARTIGEGFESLMGGKALQEAEVLGPRVRGVARRETNAAVNAINTHTPMFDPIGRFRSPAELIRTLRPVVNESPIDAVRKTFGNPDIARAMVAAARTPQEQLVIQTALDLQPVLAASSTKVARETLETAVARAREEAFKGSLTRRGTVGTIGYALGGAKGAAIAVTADAVLKRVFDRVLNVPALSRTIARTSLSPTARALGRATSRSGAVAVRGLSQGTLQQP